MSDTTGAAPSQSAPAAANDPPPDKGRGKLGASSYALIGLGVLSAAAGIILLRAFQPEAGIDRGIYTFLVCIGFAIVLSEIGTRAAVRSTVLNTGIAVTGSGVVAVGLYVLLYPGVLCELGISQDACPQERGEVEVKGTLRGDFSADNVRTILMRAPQGDPILGAFDVTGNSGLGPYLFEIKASHLVEGFDTCIKVSILEDQNTVLDVPIVKVQERLADHRPLVWQFDRNEGAILEGVGAGAHAIGTVVCGNALPVDRPTETTSLSDKRSPGFASAAGFVSSAQAQDNAPQISAEQLKSILQLLDSSTAPLEQQVLRAQIESGDPEVINKLGLWLAEAPDDKNRQEQVALALPELLDAKSIQASFAGATPEAKQAIAALLYSDQSDVSKTITSVLIANADASWVKPLLLAREAHPDAHSEGEALVLRTLHDKADEAGKAAIEDAIRSDPRLAAMPELKDLIANNSAEPASVGWSFYGITDKDGWRERYFDRRGEDAAAMPQAGDTLTANASVNIRAGPIEFEPKVGWVNQRTLDVAKPGQSFTVLQQIEVVPGFVWVKLAAAE